MKVETKKNKETKVRKGIFKYIKLRALIILLVLLIFNSYAWFIFATRASTSLQVHVTSWNVAFRPEGGTTSTNIIVDVNQIYPGMPDFEKVIIVENTGETIASLKYEYKRMILLGTTYEVGQSYTPTTLKNKIENDYPFQVSVTIDQDSLIAGTGSGTFTITITWPFESGDDAEDTYWGQSAYNYYIANNTLTCLQIELDLIAEQENSE